jgi:hypothetical protein
MLLGEDDNVDSQLKTSQMSRPLEQKSNQTKCLKIELTSDSDDYSSYYERDEWLLKFEVNEKGVGQILIPPSLTIFLQSDRVCIMSTGGGLFIKSV